MAAAKRFSGSRLRELRERANVSRIDLAYACRRTEQMVYLWERGRARPMPEVLDSIASAISCERDELFEEVADGAR